MIYPGDRLKDLIANNTDGSYLPSRTVQECGNSLVPSSALKVFF
jgi:hypothetical protein